MLNSKLEQEIYDEIKDRSSKREENNQISYNGENYNVLKKIGNGFSFVCSSHRYFISTRDGKVLTDLPLKMCEKFNDNGFVKIINEDWGYNLLSETGDLVLDKWYKSLEYFGDKLLVKLNTDKYALIDYKGNFILDDRLDRIGNFPNHENVKIFIKNNFYNFYHSEKGYLSTLWFNEIKINNEGLVKVKYNDVWYIIDENGSLFDINTETPTEISLTEENKNIENFEYFQRAPISCLTQQLNEITSKIEQYMLSDKNDDIAKNNMEISIRSLKIFLNKIEE